MTITQSSEELHVALARRAADQLLANGWRHPDAALIGALADPARWSSCRELLERLDAEVAAKLDGLRSGLPIPVEERTGDSVALLTSLCAAYVRLFGHAVCSKCPPYELEYGRTEIIQQAAELADIAGFYSAFGLEMNEASFERVDHVATECEFISVLCAKEARAIATDDGSLLESCFDAERSFLRDHLARWLPAFTHRVREADGDGFYAALAEFSAHWIGHECRHFEIGQGPQLMELTLADPGRDAEISCESIGAGGEQLVQIGFDLPHETG